MFVRLFGTAACVIVLAFGVAAATGPLGDWKSAEIVTFNDFDDVAVKLDGKAHKAFLVGLRPIRESVKGKEEQERARNVVRAKFKKSELSAQIVTRRGEVLGLSIDAFAHRKHGFDHECDPSMYPYCGWTGWFAYNFNSYFVFTGAATFQDNFGDNKYLRAHFPRAVKKSDTKDKK